MEKADVVASLGSDAPSMVSLLKPAQVRLALKANDRLKLYLTVLQTAVGHAHAPHAVAVDLGRDIAATDISSREEVAWLNDLPATASLEGKEVRVPELQRLSTRLSEDLEMMAKPVVEGEDADKKLAKRVEHWQEYLANLTSPLLDEGILSSLMHGQRDRGDSLHITVMDLHKALNRLAADLSNDVIDGAHCWQLAEDGSDYPRVQAFMRGLNRTKPLKLDHPGLDTAATRDGGKLLIQNDIGTNDAHVLVLQVDTSKKTRVITLTYSDLHRPRFAFFQRLLSEAGAQWSNVESRQTPGLNAGVAFHVGIARFEADDEDTLCQQLEAVGERIVFLIDWNRARKRLIPFVSKRSAIEVLETTTRQRAGHMAWLVLGAERLIWDAMAAQGANAFRLGDRLDAVLGEETAKKFLIDSLLLASRATFELDSTALVSDQIQGLLARCLHGRRGEYDLLEEHAGYCHALAQSLRDTLVHNSERDTDVCMRLAARAKSWERKADELVMHAREQADRQPQWQPLVRLMECSDNVADALEEACFVLSLLAEHFSDPTTIVGWNHNVSEVLGQLADAVLNATQDHIKALAVARSLGETSNAEDHREYLAAAWRVQQAERHCDELLRTARRVIAAYCRENPDPVMLSLSNDFAHAIEDASDSLLLLAYGLRERALQKIGVSTL